jgi:hypothetical protein
MPIYSATALNTAALSAADLYVLIVSPQNQYVQGVATNILGIVGIASWGPTNSPISIGSPNDLAQYFGSPQDRKYDLATAISISLQLGANNQRCVRVTDGTDLAASVALKDSTETPLTGMTLTAIYTGTSGNTIQAAISTGTAVNSFKLTIYFPGQSPEIYDNITGSGSTLWQNFVNAVNNGLSSVRSASQLAIASIGASTSTPNVAATYTMSGGTDGATTVTDTTLLGEDGNSTTRTGMYALRGTGHQVLNLVDVTSSSTWPTQTSFANSEGSYAIGQTAAGTTYAPTSAALNTAGVDDWHFKLLVGDWAYWLDTVNGGLKRMVAPATVEAANIASSGPHISTLNMAIGNIIATQRVLANQPYDTTEIGALSTARLDVITNPCPGGNYYGMRSGRNCSSATSTNDDTYTRMTNFLSLTFAATYGYVVGKNQTTIQRRQVKSSLEALLSNLETQGMIGDPNGGPCFSVKIDQTNNPDSQVALGYEAAAVQVKYLNVIRYFLISMEGGGSVSVNVSNSSSLNS